MDYAELIRKLGSLHSLLRELEQAGMYQGEHTIAYKGLDGTQQTVHVYIDGTDLQMSHTAARPGFSMSTDISGD